MSIRLLLVDDHPLFVSGLGSLLGSQPDIEVIGKAADGKEALQHTLDEEPDIVLIDITMPGMNGIEATRQILAKQPETKVICLSIHAEQQFVTAALQAGVSGYVLKDCTLDELMAAIRAVAANGSFLSPGIAGTILETYRANEGQTESADAPHLTEREAAILQRLVDGASTREIATQLHLSVKTIASHRQHIMEKLGIHTIAGLTKYAIREGLTSLEASSA